jgi:methionyl-tRNA formyltransferase
MDKVIIFADHTIGYNLTEFLIQESENNNCEIVSIFSNDNENSWWKNIVNLASKASIDFKYYTDQIALDYFKDVECDYLLLFSWKHILPVELLNQINIQTLNLHYSLLPKHRGVYPVNWSIQEGDKETGITYHLVNSKIDCGNIVVQEKIPILTCDNSKTLLDKLDVLALKTFKKIWKNRDSWKGKSLIQGKKSSYHSRKDFETTSQINLKELTTPEKFIQLMKAKSFGKISSLYFIDEEGKKYELNIDVKERK